MNQELKEKIVVAFEELTPNQLIADIHLTDEEYGTLIEMTKIRVASLLSRNATFPPPDETLSLALVQIGIREYEYGNYWNNFAHTIQMDIKNQIQGRIGNVFYRTLNKYNLFLYDKNEEQHRSRYVHNILLHGFVPRSYLADFFSFLVAFYKLNLFEQLPDSLDEPFDELSDFMDKVIPSNQDHFMVQQYFDKPIQYYKLVRSSQRALSEKKLKTPRVIMTDLLKMVDEYSWNGEISPKRDTSFYYDHFTEWMQKNDTDLALRKQKNQNRYRLVNQKPYLRLNYENQEVEIVLPPRRVRESDFENTIDAIIQNLSSTQKITLHSYRCIGTINTEEFILPINDYLFTDFSIEISSMKSLGLVEFKKKKYYLFSISNHLNEIQQLETGNIVLLTKPDSKVEFPYDSNILAGEPEDIGFGVLYYLAIEENSVICIDDEIISTSESYENLFLVDPVQHDIEFVSSTNSKPMVATKKHPVLLMQIEKEVSKWPILYINKKKHLLSSINQAAKEFSSINSTHVRVQIDLNLLLPTETGEYFVNLDFSTSNKKKHLLCNYFLVDSFFIEQSRPVYATDEPYEIQICSDIVFKPLFDCVSLDDNHFSILGKYDLLEFTTSGCDETIMRYKVKRMKWKFNGQEWTDKDVKTAYFHDLEPEIIVNAPGTKDQKLVLDGLDVKTIEGKFIQQDQFLFNIGEWIEAISNTPAIVYKIKLHYSDNFNNKKSTMLFHCVEKPTLLEFNPYFDRKGKKLACYVNFLSKDKLHGNIYDTALEKFVCSNIKFENGVTVLDFLDPKKNYRFDCFFMHDSLECSFNSKYSDYIGPFYWYSNLEQFELIVKKVSYYGEELSLGKHQYLFQDIKSISFSNQEYNATMVERSHLSNTTIFPQVRVSFSSGKMRFKVFDNDSKENQDNKDIIYDEVRCCLMSVNNFLKNPYSNIQERFLLLYKEEVDFEVEYRRVDE